MNDFHRLLNKTVTTITTQRTRRIVGGGFNNDATALEIFMYSLPFIILIVVAFITTIILIKSTFKEEKYSLFDKYKSEEYNITINMVKDILKQTNGFYISNRKQMFIIFISAVTSSFIGLLTLIISFFIIKTEIIALAGGITSLVSGSLFWIYRKCYIQNKYYFDKRNKIESALIAFQIATELDGNAKNKNIEKIIHSLLN